MLPEDDKPNTVAVKTYTPPPKSSIILDMDHKGQTKNNWLLNHHHPIKLNDSKQNDEYHNGNLNNNNNRRNSDTNVWSPLLQQNLQHQQNTKNLSSNDDINKGAIYKPTTTDWKDSEDTLRNGLSISGNNNGSHELMNGNGKMNGNDKEHDPLTGDVVYKKSPGKNNYDAGSNSGSYGNTTESYVDDHDGPSCGIFGFRPRWARKFASTHTFMVVFLLAWILQGMYLTYFVSVITTIEKLFQIKSKTTGMLLSASEIGQISTAMLLTYYAGRGHRPRWIASGMLLFSLAAFCCALPHFIFGEQLMNSGVVINSGKGFSQKQQRNFINKTDNLVFDLTLSHDDRMDNLNLCLISNNNSSNFGNEECKEEMIQEQNSHSKITVIVLCIFFVSLLSSGIGQTAVSTLGIPYIDDNVASRESPIYLAITIGVRILGPATGFIVGSFCTRIFVDLSKPDFDPSDPRWISAWWLGPIMIGTLMMLASIAMFSFPKDLRGKRTTSPTSLNSDDAKPPIEEEAKPKLKDFPKTVRRQLSNDILMFRTASSVFHLLPIAGLYTFLPKYLETQFRLPAADANLITAFGGILVMGVGIIISGILILKMNPSAKSVAAWIAFTALMYSLGMAVLMFVGCNMDDFAGLQRMQSDVKVMPSFVPTCNMTCSCDLNDFAPICGADGKTYFSSCHAGCGTAQFMDGKPKYTNCECIPKHMEGNEIRSDGAIEAVGGYCDSNCKNFIYFICIFAFCVFIHSTSEVGSMLVIMRCTDPKDKAMAMGVIQSAIGLFGNVPCPIIYGAVVDSACLVWKTVCGKHGACSLYDVDTFRHYFLGITSGIMFIAFIMDLIVWSKADRIDIAPEDISSTETELEKPINTPDTSV